MTRSSSRVAVSRIATGSIVAFAIACAVAACGHGASSVAPGTSKSGYQAVQFHITVPTQAPLLAKRRPGVNPNYISSQTTQAGVTVTPQGGVPFPTTYFSCTSSSCTGTVEAPVGVDMFAVSLYTGNRISPDTLLSTGATTATIQAGTTNYVNVTFDPVVSSVALSIMPHSLPPGTPGSAIVTVNATDVAGQTIIGPGTYVNSSGTPLTIDLANVDTFLGGGHGHSTTLSATTLTGPPAQGPTQVTLSYDGNPNLAQTNINVTTSVPVNGTLTGAVLTVAASPSPTPTKCNITATPQPTATFFLVPINPGNPYDPVGDTIAVGPDGNLYTSDGATRVFQFLLNGKSQAFTVPGAAAGSNIYSMTAGPASGNTVWFADLSMRSVGRITMGSPPPILLFSVPDIEQGHQSQPAAIGAGPDGNMWFTDRGSDYLGSIAPLLGTINEYPIPTDPNRLAQGVAVLPSGQLWFVESGSGKLAVVQISSLQLGTTNPITEYKPASSQPGELRFIAASPDGNIWFTEPQSNKVGRVNVAAMPITIDEFSVPTEHAQPTGIGVGPDGAMWFTELSGKLLGRIPFAAPAGTVPQEFSYGMAAPAGIVTAPDCSLWVTDQKAPRGRVGQIKF